jgi:hypothetical protein
MHYPTVLAYESNLLNLMKFLGPLNPSRNEKSPAAQTSIRRSPGLLKGRTLMLRRTVKFGMRFEIHRKPGEIFPLCLHKPKR